MVTTRIIDVEEIDGHCPDCRRTEFTEVKNQLNMVKCDACGNVVHGGIVDIADDLEYLAERDDTAGEIARRFLNSGNATEESTADDSREGTQDDSNREGISWQ